MQFSLRWLLRLSLAGAHRHVLSYRSPSFHGGDAVIPLGGLGAGGVRGGGVAGGVLFPLSSAAVVAATSDGGGRLLRLPRAACDGPGIVRGVGLLVAEHTHRQHLRFLASSSSSSAEATARRRTTHLHKASKKNAAASPRKVGRTKGGAGKKVKKAASSLSRLVQAGTKSATREPLYNATASPGSCEDGSATGDVKDAGAAAVLRLSTALASDGGSRCQLLDARPCMLPLERRSWWACGVAAAAASIFDDGEAQGSPAGAVTLCQAYGHSVDDARRAAAAFFLRRAVWLTRSPTRNEEQPSPHRQADRGAAQLPHVVFLPAADERSATPSRQLGRASNPQRWCDVVAWGGRNVLDRLMDELALALNASGGGVLSALLAAPAGARCIVAGPFLRLSRRRAVATPSQEQVDIAVVVLMRVPRKSASDGNLNDRPSGRPAGHCRAATRKPLATLPVGRSSFEDEERLLVNVSVPAQLPHDQLVDEEGLRASSSAAASSSPSPSSSSAPRGVVGAVLHHLRALLVGAGVDLRSFDRESLCLWNDAGLSSAITSLSAAQSDAGRLSEHPVGHDSVPQPPTKNSFSRINVHAMSWSSAAKPPPPPPGWFEGSRETAAGLADWRPSTLQCDDNDGGGDDAAGIFAAPVATDSSTVVERSSDFRMDGDLSIPPAPRARPPPRAETASAPPVATALEPQVLLSSLLNRALGVNADITVDDVSELLWQHRAAGAMRIFRAQVRLRTATVVCDGLLVNAVSADPHVDDRSQAEDFIPLAEGHGPTKRLAVRAACAMALRANFPSEYARMRHLPGFALSRLLSLGAPKTVPSRVNDSAAAPVPTPRPPPTILPVTARQALQHLIDVATRWSGEAVKKAGGIAPVEFNSAAGATTSPKGIPASFQVEETLLPPLRGTTVVHRWRATVSVRVTYPATAKSEKPEETPSPSPCYIACAPTKSLATQRACARAVLGQFSAACIEQHLSPGMPEKLRGDVAAAAEWDSQDATKSGTVGLIGAATTTAVDALRAEMTLPATTANVDTASIDTAPPPSGHPQRPRAATSVSSLTASSYLARLRHDVHRRYHERMEQQRGVRHDVTWTAVPGGDAGSSYRADGLVSVVVTATEHATRTAVFSATGKGHCALAAEVKAYEAAFDALQSPGVRDALPYRLPPDLVLDASDPWTTLKLLCRAVYAVDCHVAASCEASGDGDRWRVVLQRSGSPDCQLGQSFAGVGFSVATGNVPPFAPPASVTIDVLRENFSDVVDADAFFAPLLTSIDVKTGGMRTCLQLSPPVVAIKTTVGGVTLPALHDGGPRPDASATMFIACLDIPPSESPPGPLRFPIDLAHTVVPLRSGTVKAVNVESARVARNISVSFKNESGFFEAWMSVADRLRDSARHQSAVASLTQLLKDCLGGDDKDALVGVNATDAAAWALSRMLLYVFGIQVVFVVGQLHHVAATELGLTGEEGDASNPGSWKATILLELPSVHGRSMPHAPPLVLPESPQQLLPPIAIRTLDLATLSTKRLQDITTFSSASRLTEHQAPVVLPPSVFGDCDDSPDSTAAGWTGAPAAPQAEALTFPRYIYCDRVLVSRPTKRHAINAAAVAWVRAMLLAPTPIRSVADGEKGGVGPSETATLVRRIVSDALVFRQALLDAPLLLGSSAAAFDSRGDVAAATRLHRPLQTNGDRDVMNRSPNVFDLERRGREEDSHAIKAIVDRARPPKSMRPRSVRRLVDRLNPPGPRRLAESDDSMVRSSTSLTETEDPLVALLRAVLLAHGGWLLRLKETRSTLHGFTVEVFALPQIGGEGPPADATPRQRNDDDGILEEAEEDATHHVAPDGKAPSRVVARPDFTREVGLAVASHLELRKARRLACYQVLQSRYDEELVASLEKDPSLLDGLL